MISQNIELAIQEITYLQSECLKLIDETLNIETPDASGNYSPSFRVVATPFLYAVWERAFSTSFSVILRVIKQTHKCPAELSKRQAALWLQKTSFYQSFSARLLNEAQVNTGESNFKKPKKGAYTNLVEFFEEIKKWEDAPIPNAPDTDDLVMTFSNVNKAVLELNANAVGLNELSEFNLFISKIGRLDELVGRRNEIGHGSLASPPGHVEFKGLVDLTRDTLINEFCDIVKIWLIFRAI